MEGGTVKMWLFGKGLTNNFKVARVPLVNVSVAVIPSHSLTARGCPRVALSPSTMYQEVFMTRSRYLTKSSIALAIGFGSSRGTGGSPPYNFKTTISDGGIQPTQLGGTPHVGLLADAALKDDKGLSDIDKASRSGIAGMNQMAQGVKTTTAAPQAGDNDPATLIGADREGIDLAKAGAGGTQQQQQ